MGFIPLHGQGLNPVLVLGIIFACYFYCLKSKNMWYGRNLSSQHFDLLVLDQDLDLGCMVLLQLVLIGWSILIQSYYTTPDLNRLLSTLLQRHSLIQTGFKDQKVQDLSMSLLSTSFALQMVVCASMFGIQLHCNSLKFSLNYLQVWYLECWSCHARIDSGFSPCFPDKRSDTCFNGSASWRVEWTNKGACIQVRQCFQYLCQICIAKDDRVCSSSASLVKPKDITDISDLMD